METIEQYLDKTESASRKLFEGMDSYIQILKSARAPVFVGSGLSEADFLEEYDAWRSENADQIKKWNEAQDTYLTESFALANLCGTVLQMAAMGIRMFGTAQDIPPAFHSLIQEKWLDTRKFCSGRDVRGIPVGLIVFAGRNQFNHYDERPKLKNPAKKVFELLSDLGLDNQGQTITDPAFDLQNEHIICFASNITSLLGWRTYEDYRKDMLEVVGPTI